ncbi:MAG: cation:proton antiporter [Bacteroidota bacterium]
MEIATSSLPFAVSILLLLFFAKVFGEIAENFNQPSMIGEIFAGFLLGPSVFNILGVTTELKVISELGVFLLIILVGLEINVDDIIKSLKGKAIFVSVLGFVLPFLSGFFIGYMFGLDRMLSVFIGLCISITALPVSVRILMDLNLLKTDFGNQIISCAIFNDVVSLMVLGVLIDQKNSIDLSTIALATNIVISISKVVLFVVVFIIVLRWIKHLTKKIDIVRKNFLFFSKFIKGKETLFAFVILFILFFASLSELLGLHLIVGTFLGAMLLNKELMGSKFKIVERTTSGISMGFLAPIFFATLGLEFNLSSITHVPLLIAIVLVSFLSKILAGFIGGLLIKYSPTKALMLGFGLNARGVMELIIAKIALQYGFITKEVFSILVFMGLITTVFTPFILGLFVGKNKEHRRLA